VGFVYSSGRDVDNSHTSDTGNMSRSWLPDAGNAKSLSKTGVLSSRPCIKPCNLLQQTTNTEQIHFFKYVIQCCYQLPRLYSVGWRERIGMERQWNDNDHSTQVKSHPSVKWSGLELKPGVGSDRPTSKCLRLVWQKGKEKKPHTHTDRQKCYISQHHQQLRLHSINSRLMKYVWSINGMILVGENWSAWSKTCPIVI